MTYSLLKKQASDLIFDIGQQINHRDLHYSALELLKLIYDLEENKSISNDDDSKLKHIKHQIHKKNLLGKNLQKKNMKK